MKIIETDLFTDFMERDCYFSNCTNNQCDCDVNIFLERISSLDARLIIKNLFRHMSKKDLKPLKPADIVQFSTFENSTTNLCRHLFYNRDKSLTFEDVGRLLLDSNRKKSALVKYGENHSKMAEMLGIAVINRDTRPYHVEITKLGEMLLKLDSNRAKKVISNLILRIEVIQQILYLSSLGEINVVDHLKFLKQSTLRRRLTSIRTLLEEIQTNSSTNLNYIFEDIEFSYEP